MQDSSWVMVWIAQLIQQAPILLVYLTGMVVAVGRWSRHPPVSMLVLAALGLLLFTTIVGSALFQWVAMNPPTNPELSWRSLLNIIGILSTCVRALALGLLIAAIFGWRGQGSRVAAS